ncbi:sigma-70 family RNA polymerase sigma factor, partial [Candidatus Poribacteria bacterium]|nr:sigma-70 family RNA polymerase sigma factor [Candidatus Poribacteria bacterium]
AFSELVYKYQKSVHALAWRKIGDFQIAEEIAQDTFLQAYEKLATLKNPTQFAGWLYVIAANLCTDWKRKKRKKPIMRSLETDTSGTLDKTSYEMYLEEQREKKAAEHRQELVKKLLDKLPESERTVVTLHYLGEMTSEAISEFLGVSVNTIKSRLRRARKRLQKEEPMIRETLGNVKLPANFVENIMKKIEKITPTPTANSKPLIPWAAIGSAALLVILLMGTSSQYLSSFQQPYSLESQSETSIEIVDASVVLDMQTEPELHKRNVRNVLARKNEGIGQEVLANQIGADTDTDSSRIAIRQNQWSQVQGPQGGDVNGIFLTSNGELLAVTHTGIYKTTENITEWIRINNTLPTAYYSKTPIAEHNNTLYIVTRGDIFASTDGGMNWTLISRRQSGDTIALLTTDTGFYLVLEKAVYMSVDEGRQWSQLNIDIGDREITDAINIGDTAFIGTEQGLYKIVSGEWEQLPVGKFKKVDSLAAADNTVYAVLSPSSSDISPDDLGVKLVREMLRDETSNIWEFFRSDDLGESWDKITPKNRSIIERIALDIKILASDQTILALGLHRYRSKDKGLTWTKLGTDTDTIDIKQVISVNENTFYSHGYEGIRYTTDGGNSWHLYMKGIIGTDIRELVSFKGQLYTHAINGILKSDDNGETWTSIAVDTEDDSHLRFREPMLTIADNMLYAIAGNYSNNPRICRLSDGGDTLLPIEEIPEFQNVSDKGIVKENTETANTDKESSDLQDTVQYLKDRLNLHEISSMAISGSTFYIVYNSRVLKWQPGFSKWVDTGLDTGPEETSHGFILAASGKTVYVGRKDGRLFQSLDEGKKWTDITTELPIQFEDFDDIIFSDAGVFIATDEGVLTSHTGKQWRVIEARNGRIIKIRRLTVDRSDVYGVHRSGVYRYSDDGKWELISPKVPNTASHLVVHNDKFFIATFQLGIFQIPVRR